MTPAGPGSDTPAPCAAGEPHAAAVRPATAADLPAINRIYNHEVLHGVATWDEQPWSAQQRERWFEARDATLPVLVATVPGIGQHTMAGFAYLSHYRPRSGYRFTREDTLYVDPGHQRRGIGRQLLASLVVEAGRADVHTLLAVIESENAASVALHEQLGFAVAGRRRQVGYKFGRWLDATEMQLLL